MAVQGIDFSPLVFGAEDLSGEIYSRRREQLVKYLLGEQTATRWHRAAMENSARSLVLPPPHFPQAYVTGKQGREEERGRWVVTGD